MFLELGGGFLTSGPPGRLLRFVCVCVCVVIVVVVIVLFPVVLGVKLGCLFDVFLVS